jgi:hypothetical protein
MISHFLFCPLAGGAPWQYLWCIGLVSHSRPSYGETRVRLGVLYWEPRPVHYCRTPVLHKS